MRLIAAYLPKLIQTLVLLKALTSYGKVKINFLVFSFIQVINLFRTYLWHLVDLQKEGYNIDNIQDKIYFYKNSKYIPLEQELYSKLMSGSLRL